MARPLHLEGELERRKGGAHGSIDDQHLADLAATVRGRSRAAAWDSTRPQREARPRARDVEPPPRGAARRATLLDGQGAPPAPPGGARSERSSSAESLRSDHA